MQDRTTPKDIHELLDAVNTAWNAQTPTLLNRVWLSLQTCLQEVLLSGGDNDYKIPHMHKKKLERAGTLPWQVGRREEAWARGESALNELQAIEAENKRRGLVEYEYLKYSKSLRDGISSCYRCCHVATSAAAAIVVVAQWVSSFVKLLTGGLCGSLGLFEVALLLLAMRLTLP